jgi:hypothetical protein
MVDNKYHGESIAKKVARVRLYRRAREALKFRGVRGPIRAMFMPGPEAAEVGALKHILGVRAQDATAIDLDPACCSVARERWPGIQTLVEDVGDSAWFESAKIAPFNFVHLDLMGTLTTDTIATYGYWAFLTELSGIFVTTYLRGREKTASMGNVLRCAAAEATKNIKRSGINTYVLSADPARASSHMVTLNDCFWALLYKIEHGVFPALELDNIDYLESNGIIFTPIATHCYKSGPSPMGVLVTQKVFHTDLRLESYQQFISKRQRHTTSVLRLDPMNELIAEAASLGKEFSGDQVAEILNVTPGTLAAWRAHQTRGTYVDCQ